MTCEEELTRFRIQEKLRPRRAKITTVVFVVLAAIAVVAFAYAFYIQTVANRNATEYNVENEKMKKALKEAEERTAKFEAIAIHEKKVTDSLNAICAQKP